MFKTFASLFVDKTSSLDPVGCFISRQDRNLRSVINVDETLGMMQEVFSRVRVIALTEANIADEIIDVLYECRVLFGFHGTGHMNAMFARLGQRYEMKASKVIRIKEWDNFYVDLFEAKAALERAKDHAA